MKLRPDLRLTHPLPRFPIDGFAAFALIGLCSSLFLQGIGSRELWASHEARAAQNAQRMLDDGDWLLPRLYDGQVELQKPPGFYWLVAAVGWVRGGVDAWAVRLPAAIAGALTVLMVWYHLRRRGRPVAGFVAAAALAGAVHFAGTARIGRIDVPLACAVTAILLLGRNILGERSRVSGPMMTGSGRLRGFARLAGIGLIGAVALLLKGPIGLLLPASVLSVYWLMERVSIRSLVVRHVAIGTVAVAVAAPWFIWANAETDGEFFRVFFVYHHFNRAFGGAEALAGRPWWFYIPRFAADFLPWTPLLLVAIFARRWRGDADARFGLVWLAVMAAILSISRFKRADYLLPAYPGAAIFLGCAVEQWYLVRTRLTRLRAAIAFTALLTVLPVGWVLFDHLVTAKEESAHEQRPFAARVREAAPQPRAVFLFRVESHLLAYHLGRPVHTLVEWNDLIRVACEPGAHFIVTRAEFVDEVRQMVPVPVEVIARSEDAGVGRPYRPLVLLHIGSDSCPNPPRD